MKVHIDIDESLEEPLITIRGSRESIENIQSILEAHDNEKLVLFKEEREFLISPKDILFFESVDSRTWAHTADGIYSVRQKLYELEEILPPDLVRASKSVIINTNHILSIKRNLTGPSQVQFQGSDKQTSISRGFYKLLKEQLESNK